MGDCVLMYIVFVLNQCLCVYSAILMRFIFMCLHGLVWVCFKNGACMKVYVVYGMASSTSPWITVGKREHTRALPGEIL